MEYVISPIFFLCPNLFSFFSVHDQIHQPEYSSVFIYPLLE